MAARHLFHFGYKVSVCYAKASKKSPMPNLVKQLHKLGVEVRETLQEDFAKNDILVDAIFGYSFCGEIREPFKSILRRVRECKVKQIVSVDVPSGWDVEEGDVRGEGVNPSVLVSLTAPKKCALKFGGRHYLGGRFVPPLLHSKYSLNLPHYNGAEQSLLLN